MYKQKHKIYLQYEDERVISKFALELQKYLNFSSYRLKDLGIVPVLLSKNINLLIDIHPHSKVILLNKTNSTEEHLLEMFKDLTKFYKPLISFSTYVLDYRTGDITETVVHYLDPNTIKEYLYGEQSCNLLLRNYCEYLNDRYYKTEKEIDLLQEKLGELLKELPKLNSLLLALKTE